MSLKRIERRDFLAVAALIEPAEGADADLRALAHIYALVAGVLTPQPDPESTEALARVACLLGIECPEDCSPSDAGRDYTELFVAPGPRYVPPYESEFSGGESAGEVRQIFFEAGLVPERDLPDHIANELRLAAYLCDQEAGARLRSRLVNEHIARWIGDLRRRVAERDQRGYYRAVLEVAEAVIACERFGEGARKALCRVAGG